MSEEEDVPQAWFADGRGTFHPVDPFHIRLMANGLVRWDAPPLKAMFAVVKDGREPTPPPVPVPLRRVVFRWYGSDILVYVEDGQSVALDQLALFAMAALAAWTLHIYVSKENLLAALAAITQRDEAMIAASRARRLS